MQTLDKLTTKFQSLSKGNNGTNSLTELKKTRNIDLVDRKFSRNKSNANILNSILSFGKTSEAI